MDMNTNWINKRSEIYEEDIKEVEKTFGVSFPKDFRDFIISYNGSSPTKKRLRFGESEDETLKSLLSFSKNDESYIMTIYNKCKSFLPCGVVPIAETESIDLICFDFRKDGSSYPSIVYWNYDLSVMDDEDSIYKICRNFSELIEILE